MAWTAPMTAVATATFTAAQFNASVRDNLLETAPAKATIANQFFVSTGANAIAARTPTGAIILTVQTTTSTSFADLATVGPQVTVVTGTRALVIVSANVTNSAAVSSYVGYAVSGASTLAATDDKSLVHDPGTSTHRLRATAAMWETGLTAGSNTFTLKYHVDSGTGTFFNRELLVIPF